MGDRNSAVTIPLFVALGTPLSSPYYPYVRFPRDNQYNRSCLHSLWMVTALRATACARSLTYLFTDKVSAEEPYRVFAALAARARYPLKTQKT